MNKEELIEQLKELKYKYYTNELFWKDYSTAINDAIVLAKQLEEPQKVKVPQFVADWYEENKDEFELNLWVFLTEFNEENIDMSERFGIWLGNEDNSPIQTLVNMHQFGYEVKKEKRYLVKFKGVVCNYSVLKHNLNEDTWYMSNENAYGDLTPYHTKEELEDAGFGEVFNSPLFEVEEVE